MASISARLVRVFSGISQRLATNIKTCAEAPAGQQHRK